MIKCNGVQEELLPPEGVGSKFRNNPFLKNNGFEQSSKEKKPGIKANKIEVENRSVVTNDVGLSFTKRSSDLSHLKNVNDDAKTRGKIFTIEADASSTSSQESLMEVLRIQNHSSIAKSTNHHSLQDNSVTNNSKMTKNASPPCFPRNLSYPCIAEEEGQSEVTSDTSNVRNSVAIESPSACGKSPVAMAMLRKQRVGLHRSHTWTACDVPFDQQFPLKRKSDGLRQGLLTRRHKQSISLQNVFCMVKETSINSVKTLIKLFEMNVVRILMFLT